MPQRRTGTKVPRVASVLAEAQRHDVDDLGSLIEDIDSGIDSLQDYDDDIESEADAERTVDEVIKDLEKAAKMAAEMAKDMLASAKAVKAARHAIIQEAIKDLVECPNCDHKFRNEGLN